MASIQRRRLGDILIADGKVTSDQIEEALKMQKTLGKRLGEVLVETNIITEEEIVEAIVKQTGIPRVDLKSIYL